jgi:molybdopterin/thiamine biosynthesis adenylyltransferase
MTITNENDAKKTIVVDYLRQLDLFTPTNFTEEVHVIGAGRVGIYTAFLLGKLGVRNIHVWDPAVVEDRHITGRLFRLKDVGKFKVDALAEIIFEATRTRIIAHIGTVTEQTPLKGVVFLLVNSIDTCKEIWDGALKFRLPVKLMVGVRMGDDGNSQIYAINTSDPGDIEKWEDFLSGSDVHICKNPVVGLLAAYLASLAVWKLIKFSKGEHMKPKLDIPIGCRQLDAFSPDKLKEKIHIIGAGATGSLAGIFLALLGFPDIHVYDTDIVKSHNLPNQIFRLEDVEKLKINALAEIIMETTGIKITTHREFVGELTPLDGVVFLLVDTMGSRKEIWDGALKFKSGVKFMIETRMAIDNGRIYAIRPNTPKDVNLWENTLYSDEKAEESSCSNRSVGPTVAYIASLAVMKLVKWINENPINYELIISARPTLVLSISSGLKR